ncbi:MAG: ribonuclease HII [Candidatus Sungbacteria bacterium]|uniref:Ribonuclease n=1 Tax=Candidatus Sungiibacteriota bacterium TaxID=2750080 RepID=A0A931WPR9_9BACT|nr:ribonuclease HII [Candidatus Sungbacteria bacterium]
MAKPWIGGIDEAGRGPLAGPVALAMVVAPKGFRFRHSELGKIRDSKKLTPRARELWFRYLTTHPRLSWARTYVHPRVIDRINIAKAAHRGARRLAERASPKPHFVYLDGSLALPSSVPHKVVIHGDDRIPVIAAASIIAKVSRDRYMKRKAKKFPRYKFEVHKGYGTRLHIKLLRRYGPSVLHRGSFVDSLI